MKKWLVMVCLSILTSFAQAEVSAQLSQNQVSLGDTFNLIINQDTSTSTGIPDLTPLQKDFSIVGTEQSMKYSLINGVAQSQRQWTVILLPKKSGPLQIPALTIGNEKTQPLSIEVGGSPNAQPDQMPGTMPDSGMQLLTTVSTDKPYINQQVIYTVRLYNSRRLLDADYQPPEVKDALLFPLGEVRRYQVIKDNQAYEVEEQQYAIFPQKSGQLTIKSPVFTGLVYAAVPKRVKATDKDIQLEIKPIPASYQGKDWLPAYDLGLTDSYENTNQKIEQGSTLTRTIKITAVGSPAQLLPELDFPSSKALSTYPEKPEDHTSLQADNLQGTRIIKVTYLLNQSGKIMIPELRIPWFNLKTGKQAYAVLPPRTLDVLPATVRANQNQIDNQISAKPAPLIEVEQTRSGGWSWGWLVASLMTGLWLLTLAFWRRQKGEQSLQTSHEKKAALRELKAACEQNNPEYVKESLLAWARVQWPHASIYNLSDIARLVNDLQFKKELNQLNQILYGGAKASGWKAAALWSYIQTLIKARPKRRLPNPLPPMNPG